MRVKLNKIKNPLKGTVELDGSKSISNRLLVIRALCTTKFNIDHLSTSNDTKVLEEALSSKNSTLDVHHAGTSFRFLCSYLALQPGIQLLTGSDRMKQRPIGPLVDALRSIGADIRYVEKEGFPPLEIGETDFRSIEELEIDASISSQFISSILLIAPSIKGGLRLRLRGELVSKPYVLMTLRIMKDFGISYNWDDDLIQIDEQNYKPQDYTVEADWSAASYYVAWVAAVPDSEIILRGLAQHSLQGDSKILDIGNKFGVIHRWEDGSLILNHSQNPPTLFEENFIQIPDLAQTVITMCAEKGIMGLFSGLKTLKIKETDRIEAMKSELAKGHVSLSKMPRKFSKKAEEFYLVEGEFNSDNEVIFDTYQDHRMAMSLSCLATKSDLIINNSEVVNKSYKNYWKDIASLGVQVEFIS